MVIAIISPGRKSGIWQRKLMKLAPGIDIRLWPELGNCREIEVVLCWKHPPGALQPLSNLKLIASLGAGVDHILADPLLPAGVPITRVVDDGLKQRMSQYLVWAVLDWCRQMPAYRTLQHQGCWQPRLQLPDYRVGIMGLGELGRDIAGHLVRLGFPVNGWSLRKKQIAGVKSYQGQSQQTDFLTDSSVLINLLPLTAATRGILCQSLFEQLPRGAFVINVGRGDHLVEQDLLEALAQGQIAGACLDVASQEPLPGHHAFWGHPNITLTPHISSITSPEAVVSQLLDNIRRLSQGGQLLNQVNRQLGY